MTSRFDVMAWLLEGCFRVFVRGSFNRTKREINYGADSKVRKRLHQKR